MFKLKTAAAAALLISAVTCLCSCTPAIDNGLTRSAKEHITIPEAGTQAPGTSGETSSPDGSSSSGEGGTTDAAQQPAADYTVTGFDQSILDEANTLLSSMTLEQKVGQMFLARCPETDAAGQASTYYLGGYLLFGRDFENKTSDQVIADIQSYQDASATPMFIAVDEEGGTVNRVSTNPQLRPYPFWSPQELYAEGGLDLVRSDAEDKSILLRNLGINLNLAPVCDVSTDPESFIYQRSFGQPAAETAEYVSTVVSAMNRQQMGSVLKHFPGYGNNGDTHEGTIHDARSYESFAESDFLPFQSGIEAGATAILVSHTIVDSMDLERPASLSTAVHDILRNDLGFNGLIMTDDLSMGAITNYTDAQDAAVQAVLAGNDLLCSTDFTTQIPAVIEAVNNGTISQERIDQSVLRILATKIQLGIIQ